MFVAIVTAPLRPGLRNDFGFLLVVLGIQDHVLHAGPLQHRTQLFRTVDRDRADQHRLALFVALFDFLDDGVELFTFGAIDHVGILDAPHRLDSSG